MAKVKARDIIPGWPRGRSTLPSNENSRWQTLMDEDYHRSQQAMVDEVLHEPVRRILIELKAKTIANLPMPERREAMWKWMMENQKLGRAEL